MNSKSMNMLSAKYIAGCLAVVALLASCKKDDSFDVKGDPTVRFFFNNEAPGNAPVNSVNYTVTNIPDVAGTGWVNLSTTAPATIKIPVYATKPVGQQVIINAALDNSLVNEYNTANNTNYVPFPAGILSADGLSATLAEGQVTSSDSISIVTNLAGLGGLTGQAYMAPIKLTTVSNGAGEITSTSKSQVSYIVFNMEQRRIKYLANTSDIIGSLVSPRTPWTVNFTPAPVAVVSGGSIIDGSNNSYSRFGESLVQVDVNMQSVKNVTGLRLFTVNSTNFTPTQVEVSLSTDGINYDVIGSPLRANLFYTSGTHYILFYKAISASYVRLKLSYSTSTSTNNRRVAELDVYAN